MSVFGAYLRLARVGWVLVREGVVSALPTEGMPPLARMAHGFAGLLERRKAAGTLSPQHYVAKTLVTTEMIRRIADAYGVRTCGELLVGFKWIAGLVDDEGPERYVFGAEESHGYQVGTYTRDKDGVVAALLMSELAARAKSQGQTLHQKLDALYWQYGCHAERTVSATMPSSPRASIACSRRSRWQSRGNGARAKDSAVAAALTSVLAAVVTARRPGRR